MIYTLGKHMQVLMETTESVARREVKPRARRKYWLACTCSERRRENGHCRHTLAIFEGHIRRNRWRDVAPQEMSSKSGATHSERPRIDLEREVQTLRAALDWAYVNVGPIAVTKISLKERVRRLNAYRDHLDAARQPPRQTRAA